MSLGPWRASGPGLQADEGKKSAWLSPHRFLIPLPHFLLFICVISMLFCPPCSFVILLSVEVASQHN